MPTTTQRRRGRPPIPRDPEEMPRKVLQVRAIDPNVSLEMHVEAAQRQVTLSELVSSMWEAYLQQRRLEATAARNGAHAAPRRNRRS